VAALKDIRHSAQLPTTPRTLRVQASPGKRAKVIGTGSPAHPGSSDHCLQTFQRSGEGEFLLPGTGRWSLAVTHLTGVAQVRYLKEVKEVFVLVRTPAIR
jgi:hypothetical protein